MKTETKEAEATPRPWRVWREWPGRNPNIPRRFHIYVGNASNPADPEYRRIATTTDMPEHIAEANARLITRAVNAHEDLVEAAERAWRLMDMVANGDHKALENLPDAAMEVRAALAKAQGEPKS